MILVFALCLGTDVLAKKYYKHTDENGITHYSDKPPVETDDFESWQVRPEDSEYELKVINRGTKETPIFYAVNRYHGPIEVLMDVVNRKNVVIEPQWPATYVVPANSEFYLATVKPKHKYMAWSFQYNVSSTLGDPFTIHEDEYAYALPFPGNKHFAITQGWNGAFSHSGEQNLHALDIAMPEGTPVLAARGGTVMDIAEDFYDSGAEMKNLQRGNYIRILHDDGSMAVYAHLKLESVIVARGQRVEKQQKIAESGNTGFSTGPHLHFVIQMNTGLKLESVPFLLRHKNGEVKAPIAGPI